MALTNFVKRVRNIMRQDAGINGDAQRIEQIAWLLFLKIYDTKEDDWAFGDPKYRSVISEEYRWRAWAQSDGPTADALLTFVNGGLFPALKALPIRPGMTARETIVPATFLDANQYMKDGTLLRQVVNVIDELDLTDYEESHAFGDIYEAILKEMQSAGTAGEFYTPRALTDFMAETIRPQIGERMADFACGTGGFLVSWLHALEPQVRTAADRAALLRSVYGIEKKQFPYMLCVTNLLLHGIDEPHILHANSLTKSVLDYGPDDAFDVILMNPPYGGSETAGIKSNFPLDLRSGETADLFMSLIMYRLKPQGRAAVVVPDGFLFGTDGAKRAIKEKLLREFCLHTVLRLPPSIFAPYTSIATNILFFDRRRDDAAPEGLATAHTWVYRVDMPEGYKHFSKTRPMLAAHFDDVRRWWPHREEIILGDGDEKARRFTAADLLATGCNLDLCRYPKQEADILPPQELLEEYYRQRRDLEAHIDDALREITAMLQQA